MYYTYKLEMFYHFNDKNYFNYYQYLKNTAAVNMICAYS